MWKRKAKDGATTIFEDAGSLNSKRPGQRCHEPAWDASVVVCCCGGSPLH